MFMNKKYETVKCDKCGYENVKHANVCKKCGNVFKAQLKSFSDSQSSFGGSLRNTEVDLNKVEYHVPTAKEWNQLISIW